MSDNSVFSVTVFLYRDGMKILSVRNTGQSDTKTIAFDKMFYRPVKKIVKSYRKKNDHFEVHLFPVLKLEDLF